MKLLFLTLKRPGRTPEEMESIKYRVKSLLMAFPKNNSIFMFSRTPRR